MSDLLWRLATSEMFPYRMDERDFAMLFLTIVAPARRLAFARRRSATDSFLVAVGARGVTKA